jgi:hypothetical protein
MSDALIRTTLVPWLNYSANNDTIDEEVDCTKFTIRESATHEY